MKIFCHLNIYIYILMSKKIQEKYLKYKTKLKNSPNNPTYEYKINKYTEEFNTIHGAGVKIDDYINNINFDKKIVQSSQKTENPIDNGKKTENSIDNENKIEEVIDKLEKSQDELKSLKSDYLNNQQTFIEQRNQFLKDSEMFLNDLKEAYNTFKSVSKEVDDRFDEEINTFHEKMDELKKRTF